MRPLMVYNMFSNNCWMSINNPDITIMKTIKLTPIFIGNPTTNILNCGTVRATIPRATSTRNNEPTMGSPFEKQS
jgi:hypothetical protein